MAMLQGLYANNSTLKIERTAGGDVQAFVTPAHFMFTPAF